MLEIGLGIPVLGASIILAFNWIPLLIMLCLHIITLVLARRDQTDLKGSVLGIVTSIVGIIPFVGMAMHLATGFLLLKDASNLSKVESKKLKHIRNFNKIERTYEYNLQPYIDRNFNIAPDTNFLMLFHELLTKLHRQTSAQIAINPIVFYELEGLKLSNDIDTVKKAQRAFDVIELYQVDERLYWLERVRNDNIKNPSNDEQILLSVQRAILEQQKIIFATHDKGARILARELKIPVVNPIKDQRNEPFHDSVDQEIKEQKQIP